MWKKIKYEDQELNYSISDDGRVRNDKTMRILTPSFQNGYYSIRLAVKPNYGKHFRINRLVAEAFIPNPENKPYVNHINGKTNDNNVNNLEWVTPSENSLHAYALGLRGPNCQVKVNQYNLAGKYMMTFDGINEAARQTGTQQSKISEVCQGTRRSAGEYQWRYYINDNIEDIEPIEQRKNIKKRVGQYDLQGNLINMYESYREAARAVNGTPSAISRLCAGTVNLHTHKGFVWKIVDDIVQEIE